MSLHDNNYYYARCPGVTSLTWAAIPRVKKLEQNYLYTYSLVQFFLSSLQNSQKSLADFSQIERVCINKFLMDISRPSRVQWTSIFEYEEPQLKYTCSSESLNNFELNNNMFTDRIWLLIMNVKKKPYIIKLAQVREIL